jgi:hypothetical protein
VIAEVRIDPDPGGVLPHRQAPRLQVEAGEARLGIERRAPQVSWDRSDYQEAVHVLPSAALGRRPRDEARADALGGIARIAHKGVSLGRIEGETTIGTIARGKLPQDDRSLTLAAVPPPVRTTEDPGGLEVDLRPGGLRLEVQLAPVSIDVEQHRVTVNTEVPSQVSLRA